MEVWTAHGVEVLQESFDKHGSPRGKVCGFRGSSGALLTLMTSRKTVRNLVWPWSPAKGKQKEYQSVRMAGRWLATHFGFGKARIPADTAQL